MSLCGQQYFARPMDDLLVAAEDSHMARIDLIGVPILLGVCQCEFWTIRAAYQAIMLGELILLVQGDVLVAKEHHATLESDLAPATNLLMALTSAARRAS
jgi:hypothetical protein